MANETLVNQIALKGFESGEKDSGQLQPPDETPNTCVWRLLQQLHPVPSHFSPSTFIASAAQDKQQ